MLSDWSVACGADDPAVVIPWTGADGSIRYVDLRESPARADEIPEAEQYACIDRALRHWNQAGSPIFTAKCDVWAYAADLYDAEDLPDFAHAQGCYIDLLSTDSEKFSNFSASEKMLRAWNEAAQSIDATAARCEWTLRPARLLSGERYVDGFATTLYVWGYGESPQAAAAAWSAALLALVEPALIQTRQRF